MPLLPRPGKSSRVRIRVSDPNLGSVERTFKLHLPAGYSTSNDMPTPLVLDFHGWGGSGTSQGYRGGFDDVADEQDANGGFIVVHPDGYGDPSARRPRNWGSWNCSRTDGPLGPPCKLPRPRGHAIHCYESCGQCSPTHSCDWTACYDDVTFIRKELAK